MNVHKNQKGVAPLAIILIAGIVGIIGFTGYRVYNMNKQDKKDDRQAITSGAYPDKEEKKEEPKSDIPEGFKEYKNEELGLKFNYPKDWGTVTVAKKYRFRAEYENVKSNFIEFSNLKDLYLVISPTSLDIKPIGTDSPLAAEETETTFEKARTEPWDGSIFLINQPDAYLQFYWNGMNDEIYLDGVKKVNLQRIPAEFVEIFGPMSTKGKKCIVPYSEPPRVTKECYSEKFRNEIVTFVQSIKSL